LSIRKKTKEMSTDRYMARWDDAAPWHPRSRRNRQSPWTQMSLLDDEIKDMEKIGFGLPKSFENALNLLHLNPPIGSPAHMQEQEHHHAEKPKKYKKKIPLVVRGILSPDDLKVSLKDHTMTVEAKKEQVSQDGSSRYYQEYNKTLTLPDSVDMNLVHTVLSHDGSLKVEAPYIQPEPVNEPTEIPIELSF